MAPIDLYKILIRPCRNTEGVEVRITTLLAVVLRVHPDKWKGDLRRTTSCSWLKIVSTSTLASMILIMISLTCVWITRAKISQSRITRSFCSQHSGIHALIRSSPDSPKATAIILTWILSHLPRSLTERRQSTRLGRATNRIVINHSLATMTPKRPLIKPSV